MQDNQRLIAENLTFAQNPSPTPSSAVSPRTVATVTGQAGISDILPRLAGIAPDAIALIVDDAEYTFRQLADATTAISSQLTPGKRVAVTLTNNAASVTAIHAAWAAGCSVVSVSAMVPAAEADRRIHETGVASVLTPSDGLHVGVEHTAGAVDAPPDEALIMFTSGTTGVPKAASLTFAALRGSVSGIASGNGIPADGRPPRDPARSPQLLLVPMAHMGGLLSIVTAWWLGKPILLCEKFSPAVVFHLLKKYRLGALRLTPAMVWELLQDPDNSELPGITTVTVGTAALPEATRTAFEQKYSVPVLRNYGQTEFAGAIAFERPADVEAGMRPDGTVGRVAPGVAVRIVDADGRPVANGEVGEITARAKSAMSGYLDSSGHPADPGTWLHTGDLGTLDDDGFVCVVGRVRDMIVCGGFNVYPAQVEAALNDLDDVADSAVAGVPDERLGEIPVAAVVLKPGRNTSSEELRTALRARLAAYELPRKIVMTDAIPRHESGKVDRPGVARHFETS